MSEESRQWIQSLLDMQQAAQRLNNLNPFSLAKYYKDWKVPHIRAGGKIFFVEAELDEWLRRNPRVGRPENIGLHADEPVGIYEKLPPQEPQEPSWLAQHRTFRGGKE